MAAKAAAKTSKAAIPAEIAPIEVTTNTVACDGGGGALGHPRVFLTLGADGRAVCGYCDRVYVRKGFFNAS